MFNILIIITKLQTLARCQDNASPGDTARKMGLNLVSKHHIVKYCLVPRQFVYFKDKISRMQTSKYQEQTNVYLDFTKALHTVKQA